MEFAGERDNGAEREFIGKKGERLIISDGVFMLSKQSSVYVLRLSSIAGFYCEKRRSYYEVRIFSDVRETVSVDARSARCLITLKNEDAQNLIAVLKNVIGG